jgi:hypothetical protein
VRAEVANLAGVLPVTPSIRTANLAAFSALMHRWPGLQYPSWSLHWPSPPTAEAVMALWNVGYFAGLAGPVGFGRFAIGRSYALGFHIDKIGAFAHDAAGIQRSMRFLFRALAFAFGGTRALYLPDTSELTYGSPAFLGHSFDALEAHLRGAHDAPAKTIGDLDSLSYFMDDFGDLAGQDPDLPEWR